MNAIINDPAPPLAMVPPRVKEILEKALEKDPKDRYQHAGDFALDLRRAPKAALAASAAPGRRGSWVDRRRSGSRSPTGRMVGGGQAAEPVPFDQVSPADANHLAAYLRARLQR